MKTIYSPQSIEKDCLTKWSTPHYFSPKNTGSPYCIVLPPPNVTGSLHMGHGFQVSLMDALVRYYRMQGYRVLWQGGTDHAGIATQMVVERQLLVKGKSRDTIERDELLATLSAWKRQSEQSINTQLRRLGASIDFSRNRFTLDEGFQTAVKETLIKLNEEGLLYRGKRLANWDPHLATAISDLEVLHTQEEGWLYYINYPLIHAKDSLRVATTRPETLFADVAIAVHPADLRYQAFIGQQVSIPLIGRAIPIIADTEVDPDFGTGCVKITPGHDFTDYKIGQRHQLPLINLLTTKATLNDAVPDRYQGMDCATARKAVIDDLKKQGNLHKKELRTLNVPRGDRSNAVIEPYLTDQWFIRMKPLAEKAIQAIESREVEFFPDNWGNVCLKWLSSIEDWCISRQLWWGHRIPAWYTKDGQYFIGRDEDSIRRQYGIDQSMELVQTSEVLDTWVSSALWPFVTLGWPKASNDMNAFYPTSVLITGFDILFFWVARMLMMGLHFTKQVPFKTVYVTGLIRDHLGQKMSKSKANVIDPLDIIEGIDLEKLVHKRQQGLMQPQMAEKIKQLTCEQFPNGIDGFGADALRMTYYSLASPTRDIRFDINRTVGYRNFCNKLWQVTRFVCYQYQSDISEPFESVNVTNSFHHWILSRLQDVIDKVHHYFKGYRFDHLTQLLYDFVWHDYCDWYVELIKPLLRSDEKTTRLEARYTVTKVLETIVHLLHPLMPFITEAIWSELQHRRPALKGQVLSELPYPTVNVNHKNCEADNELAWIQQVVKAIRALRNELNLHNHQLIHLRYATEHSKTRGRVHQYRSDIERFVKGCIQEGVTLDPVTDRLAEQQTTIRMEDITWFAYVETTAHLKTQIDRLHKEKIRLDKEIARLEQRLSDPGFVSKAPSAVVEKTHVQRDSAYKKRADTEEKLLLHQRG